MKKILKIAIILLILLIVLLSIDLISIKYKDKPIFIFNKTIEGTDTKYEGIFYNTFYCFNEDETHIETKNSKFSCPKIANNIAMGVITDINNNYFIITGINNENYLTHGLEAHILLSNNPKITGANNLMVGQVVKIKIITVKEIYPPMITTSEIKIIY